MNYYWKKKANINIYNKKGFFPLYVAASSGYTQTAQLLCEKKAAIDLFNSEGFTALHIAAFNGHEATVKILQEFKADIDKKDRRNYWTALTLAAHNDHTAIVKMLFQTPSLTEATNINMIRKEMVIKLAKSENFANLKNWLKQYNYLYDSVRDKLLSHLIDYIQKKNVSQLQLFQQNLPDEFYTLLNTSDEFYKHPLLHTINCFDFTDEKSYETINYLLKQHKPTDECVQVFFNNLTIKAELLFNENNFHHISRILSHYKEVKFEPNPKNLFQSMMKYTELTLINKLNSIKSAFPTLFYSLINKQELPDGNTLIQFSAAQGNREMIKYLIENKADPTIKNYNEKDFYYFLKIGIKNLSKAGNYADILILANEYKEKPLIKEKVKQQYKDFMFNRFMSRTQKGHKATIENLHKSLPHLIKSMINKPDENNNTAVLLAAAAGEFETVHWLLDNGASLSIKNNKSQDFYFLFNKGIEVTFLSRPDYPTYLYQLKCKHFYDQSTQKITPIEKNLIDIFHCWIMHGDIQLLNTLNPFLPLAKTLSEQKDEKGRTTLSLATRYGYPEVMQWLFSKGITKPSDPDFFDDLIAGIKVRLTRYDFNRAKTLLNENTELSLRINQENCKEIKRQLDSVCFNTIENIFCAEREKLTYETTSLKIEELTRNFPDAVLSYMDIAYKNVFFEKLSEKMAEFKCVFVAGNFQLYYHHFTYMIYWLAFHGWEIDQFNSVIEQCKDLNVKNIVEKCINTFENYSECKLTPEIQTARKSAVNTLFSSYVYTKEVGKQDVFKTNLDFFIRFESLILHLLKILHYKKSFHIVELYEEYARTKNTETAFSALEQIIQKYTVIQVYYPHSLRFWKKNNPEKHQSMINDRKKIEEAALRYGISPLSHI